MSNCVKLILKIAAIVAAAAAVATAVTLLVLKLTKKKDTCCCEEACECVEEPVAEELPEEYNDFADVEPAE